MIDQIVNIFFELKKAFTPAPKKEECTNMQRWYHPPEHINCRCIARPIAFEEEMIITTGDGRRFSIPPSFEERRRKFDEDCHFWDAVRYAEMPYIHHHGETKLGVHEQVALARFIDAIYENPIAIVQEDIPKGGTMAINLNTGKAYRDRKSEPLMCIICFNLECSCRI